MSRRDHEGRDQPDGDDGSPTVDAEAATGVVLAGGRSTRFERGDKALASVHGAPMLARVVARLGTVTEDVVVNCRDAQREPFERALATVDVPVRFAVDDRPDEGPLVGLNAALDAVGTSRVLVVACDLPFLDPDALAALLAMVDGDADSADAAVPVDADGYVKPTCAAYRTVPLARSIATALTAGDRRLRDALDGLDVRTVAPDVLDAPERMLADVDTRSDLERLVADHGTDEDRD